MKAESHNEVRGIQIMPGLKSHRLYLRIQQTSQHLQTNKLHNLKIK